MLYEYILLSSSIVHGSSVILVAIAYEKSAVVLGSYLLLRLNDVEMLVSRLFLAVTADSLFDVTYLLMLTLFAVLVFDLLLLVLTVGRIPSRSLFNPTFCGCFLMLFYLPVDPPLVGRVSDIIFASSRLNDV